MGETTAKRVERLRKAAYAADEAYSRELARAYGKRAGDKRYSFVHEDVGVDRAMRAKLAADRAYMGALDALGDPL
jgi:hypothetical protein